jgi:LacI family transcriptional regulator
MKRLIAKYPDITAVFAMSDVMAIGAIRAAKDLGYNVPADLSVIGFDGTELADYYNPRLATVRQQYKKLALRSIELLFAQIELKYDPVHETIPFELSFGESIERIERTSK